jgi:hypothetical protein
MIFLGRLPDNQGSLQIGQQPNIGKIWVIGVSVWLIFIGY